MYITYLSNTSYMLLGYLTGYFICKLFNPKAFLIISFKNKKYLIRLHHYYVLFFSLIAAISNLQNLMFATLGLGLHDLITEIKKILNNIFVSKKS
ncbi:MAG: hypothetical protein QXQ16_02435 [Candidatus Aenigmatarchaeota archaeon]